MATFLYFSSSGLCLFSFILFLKRWLFYAIDLFAAPLPPELLDIPDDFLEHSASDGTIEENFEEELARAPEVYAEVSAFDDADRGNIIACGMKE